MTKSLLIIFLSLCLSAGLYVNAYAWSNVLNDDDPETSASACRGVDSSAIKYVVGGRPAPYNFAWRVLGSTTDLGTATLNNDIDSINITGLDGTLDYVVIVTDDMAAVLCQDTFLISSIGELDAMVTQNPSTMCTASATAQVQVGGMTIPNPENNLYSFLWNNGETSQVAAGLSTGPANVLITSPEGCTADANIVISGPADPLTISNPVISTPLCPGGNDGTLSIQITGGNPSSGAFPYTIQWARGTTGLPADLSQNPLDNTRGSDITAGDYNVTVTDADGCQVIGSYTIPDPAPVSIDGFVNVAQSTCAQGACDGRAEVQLSGGSNPSAGYDITWSNGETTPTALLLCAGTNTIEVSNVGCEPVTGSVDITSANMVTSLVIDSTNALCFNQMNGAIEVAGNGGSSPYSFQWDDGGTGNNRNGLSAGSYIVTVTDLNGCTADPRSVTITEPDSLELIVELGGTLNPRCNGDDNGIIATRWVRGGNMNSTPTYTWSSNVPSAPNDPIATGLSAGTYSVTLTDGNGCSDETSYTLTTPPPLIGRMTMPDEPNCFGELTNITIDTAIGGTGTSFTFSVNNGPQQQLGNPNQVIAGTHIISVFDRNACRWDTSLVIRQPDEVTVDIIDEITIDLGDSAQLMPNVPTSVMIDSIIWTPLGNLTCDDCLMPWITPTQSATYQITVIDDNGCRGSDQIKVNLNRARNIYVPNAFSPNGDGINDFFQMSTGSGVNRINYLRIFNRWGELLYQQEDFLPGGDTDGWNGEFKGRDQNPGTYVFVSEVLFQDNTTLIYRGAVNLIR